MHSNRVFLALASFAVAVSAVPMDPTSLVRRNNTGTTPSAFAFTNIATASQMFVDGPVATIPSIKGAVLTNSGTAISLPVSGSVSIDSKNLTLESLVITTPAIFTLDGEWYPAALRLNTKEGSALSFLFILTPDEPNTPIINTILDAVGTIPAKGDTATLGELDFTFFVDTYISPDVFYKTEAAGTTYYVRQLPLSMELVKWRGLKKILTVA